MTNLVKVKDNTEEHAPINPIITYEVIADMGEDGTKTIFSTDCYADCFVAIKELNTGEFRNLDLNEQELEALTGVSISIVLTAQELDIITYDGEQSATAELVAYKIAKD